MLLYIHTVNLERYSDLSEISVHPELIFFFSIKKPRAGNSLIGFPSESLVFCTKMSDSLILSFLVSDLSDLLTSLIFNEQPERFTHIAHKKEEMSDSLIFSKFNKKTLRKHSKTRI